MSKPTDRRLGPLLRDLVEFQAKLMLDAVRDVVLIPVALIAGALDLLLIRAAPPRYFRAVLRIGRRSEDWLDLWAALARDRYGLEPDRIDGVIAHAEAVLRDPATGPRKARVLRRWLERQARHARDAGRRAVLDATGNGAPGKDVPAVPAAVPPPPPHAPSADDSGQARGAD